MQFLRIRTPEIGNGTIHGSHHDGIATVGSQFRVDDIQELLMSLIDNPFSIATFCIGTIIAGMLK